MSQGVRMTFRTMAAAPAVLLLCLPACAKKNEVKLNLEATKVIVQPAIQYIRFEPEGPLKTYDKGYEGVQVRMVGDKDLTATFEVEGRFPPKAMQQVQPGVYVGSFDVRKGEGGTLAATGYLQHPSIAEARREMHGERTLVLDPTPPADDPNKFQVDDCRAFDEDLRTLTVRFDFDRSELTQAARELLTKNISVFLAHPGCTTIYVHGHADQIGTEEYNMRLSRVRALEVENFLVSLGLAKQRLEVHWHGQTQPVVTGTPLTAEKLAPNRRVEFTAFKTD